MFKGLPQGLFFFSKCFQLDKIRRLMLNHKSGVELQQKWCQTKRASVICRKQVFARNLAGMHVHGFKLWPSSLSSFWSIIHYRRIPSLSHISPTWSSQTPQFIASSVYVETYHGTHWLQLTIIRVQKMYGAIPCKYGYHPTFGLCGRLRGKILLLCWRSGRKGFNWNTFEPFLFL